MYFTHTSFPSERGECSPWKILLPTNKEPMNPVAQNLNIIFILFLEHTECAESGSSWVNLHKIHSMQLAGRCAGPQCTCFPQFTSLTRILQEIQLFHWISMKAQFSFSFFNLHMSEGEGCCDKTENQHQEDRFNAMHRGELMHVPVMKKKGGREGKICCTVSIRCI